MSKLCGRSAPGVRRSKGPDEPTPERQPDEPELVKRHFY